MLRCSKCFFFFFFNDTATTEIYTLSLHDALPIFHRDKGSRYSSAGFPPAAGRCDPESSREWQGFALSETRSEEHTSELQSHSDLVCRLLLEKKKKRLTLMHIVSQ